MSKLIQSLDGIEVITDNAQVAKLSQDYHTFSPVLTQKLKCKVADFVIRPQTEEEFLEINGVGRHKLKKYGKAFITEMAGTQIKAPETKVEVSTEEPDDDVLKVTFELYEEGLSIAEIARRREQPESTIYMHLTILFQRGKPVDMYQYISEDEVKAIHTAKTSLKDPKELKPYFDYFKEEMPYHKIRIGLMLIELASAEITKEE